MKGRRWFLGVVWLAGCGGEPVERETGAAERCTLEDPGVDPLGLAQPGNGQKYAVWPNGRVPYVIDASLDAVSKANALTAMSNWQTKSSQRVRFEPAKTNESPRLVVVGGASPVTNHVGYRSTNSKITLEKGSSVSLIRHELGHVLGLHHEHRHPQRDKYIQVKMENVKNTNYCLDQFKPCASCLPVGEYDVGSVMHYDTNDLDSCTNGPVLLHLDGSPISHVWVLTDGDIANIHEMYGPPPSGTGGTGGAGGSGGSSGGSAGSGASAGAAGAGSGGTTGAAGSGGVAGSALAGAGGIDDVIDAPDTPAPGGSGATAEDGGSCGVGRASSGAGAWWALVALALAALGRARGRAPD